MYKDLYKKANENIPTLDAKMRVMAKVKKPRIVKKTRRILETASLAACLIITVASVGIYNNFEKSQNNDILKVAGEFPVETVEKSVERLVETPPKALQDKKQTSSPAPKKAETDTQTEFSKPTEEPQVAVSFAPIDVQTEMVEEAVKATLVVNESSQTEYDVSPTALMMDRSVGKVEEVSREEYYQYIGKNIEEDIVLPDGFELISDETAFFETDDKGTYKNDNWCFIYESDEKSVEIVTSKNVAEIKEKLSDDSFKKSQIKDTEAVVIKENDIYKSYMINSDVGYTVTSFGILEEDIENILVSLTE